MGGTVELSILTRPKVFAHIVILVASSRMASLVVSHVKKLLASQLALQIFQGDFSLFHITIMFSF